MNETLKAAQNLYNQGWAVIWLHSRSKRPLESGWTSGERHSWEHLMRTYKEGLNLGVRTGRPSKVAGGYLACIDVDIKDPSCREAAESKLKELVGESAYSEVRSGSGNGSRHLYVVTKEPFKMITIAKETGWEICIYSDGRQMVLPPSIHPDTGKAYVWETAVLGAPAEFDVEPYLGKAPVKNKKNKTVNRAGVDYFDFKAEPVEIAWLPISEHVREGILFGTNVRDRSGFLLPAATALLSAGLSTNEILSVLTDPDTYLGACGYEHAKTNDRNRAAQWVYRYTLAKILEERNPRLMFADAKPLGPQAPLSEEAADAQSREFSEDQDWRWHLTKTAKGKAAVTLKNLDLILSNSIKGSVFVKDLFANRIAYGADVPWGQKKDRYIEDIDMILVKRWLADTEFGIEPPTAAIHEVTSLLGHRKAIHPVREWLSSLTWDGTPRIDTWLKDFCKAKAPEPYLSEVSRKFLLAMVKRVFEPGCQWDYVLVLEGKQGKFKSSIARALASDKWFLDNLPDLKDKDAMLNLQGSWLIELGELTNIKRSDHNLVKAYLVRRTDKVRPHYGRIMAEVPRQSVFIGTVNEGQYLKDPTGNRRFWPVHVEDCDVPGLTALRDQLFAEAVSAYLADKEVLMLSPEASRQAADAQEERRIDDDETGMREELEDFMQAPRSKDFNFDRFRVRELFDPPGAPWAKWRDNSYAAQTAAIVLRNLGFERRKIHGQRIWGRVENESFFGAPEFVENGENDEIRGQGAPPRILVKEYDFM